MRRFGSRQPSFSSSPLCPSVPLDGSETVLGLRDLDKHHRATKEAEALAERSKQTSSVQQRLRPQSRGQHRRYQGPYFHQLTSQDLRRQPQDWQCFIGMESHAGPCTSWAASFNVPEHVNMLAERLEENLVHFLGNYLILAVLLFSIIMARRPWALVGCGAMGGLWVLQRRAMASPEAQPSSRPSPGTSQPTAVDGGTRAAGLQPGAVSSNQDNLTAAMPMLTIMGWVLFIYTSCLTALLRWGSLTALLVLLHASFMRPASELSWSRQGGRRTLGWSLAELYMGRPASGPGSGRLDRRSTRSHEDPGDPRQLLREISDIVCNAAGQAWLLCIRYPQEWLQQALDMVRYPRVFLNNSNGF